MYVCLDGQTTVQEFDALLAKNPYPVQSLQGRRRRHPLARHRTVVFVCGEVKERRIAGLRKTCPRSVDML